MVVGIRFPGTRILMRVPSWRSAFLRERLATLPATTELVVHTDPDLDEAAANTRPL